MIAFFGIGSFVVLIASAFFMSKFHYDDNMKRSVNCGVVAVLSFIICISCIICHKKSKNTADKIKQTERKLVELKKVQADLLKKQAEKKAKQEFDNKMKMIELQTNDGKIDIYRFENTEVICYGSYPKKSLQCKFKETK